jgi:hypothetical protein
VLCCSADRPPVEAPPCRHVARLKAQNPNNVVAAGDLIGATY